MSGVSGQDVSLRIDMTGKGVVRHDRAKKTTKNPQKRRFFDKTFRGKNYFVAVAEASATPTYDSVVAVSPSGVYPSSRTSTRTLSPATHTGALLR